MTLAIILASLIFVVSLVLIFFEKADRVIISLAGAVLMVTLGKWLGFFSEEQAVAAVDFNTLGLLLGMMILVALLEPTGFFEYVAVWTGRISRGKPVRLLILLGTATMVVSMFLNNATTVVLVAPVTILICEILGISPIPFLITEALFSNTGGVATLIGDPPNVIISSAAGFSFMDFLTHALPVVVVVWLAALILLRFLFRRELAMKPRNMKAILQLDPGEALHDRKSATRILVVLGAAILAFLFAHPAHLSLAYVALCASAIALVWVAPDMKKTLMHVDWSVLFFFAALFVMVGGLEASGALDLLVRLIQQVEQLQPLVLGVIILWVVAGLSAVVDNIPITIAMIPVIQGLGSTGMEVGPLWWALAFGAGFGGNGTIIGSTANIVVASLSEKTHSPITSRVWNKRGLPVMLVTCATASLLYVLFFPFYLH